MFAALSVAVALPFLMRLPLEMAMAPLIVVSPAPVRVRFWAPEMPLLRMSVPALMVVAPL